LTHEHKLKLVQNCRAFLTHYYAEGEGFLACIVTGDEIGVHYYEPDSRRQSMDWQHTSSAKKKFKSAPSAGKFMLTLFWDMNGPILK
jgi:hypothetical protein